MRQLHLSSIPSCQSRAYYKPASNQDLWITSEQQTSSTTTTVSSIMVVITWLMSGAIAGEKRAFATSRRNKSPLVPRKLHLWTQQNGTGKAAIGKSWGHGVAATTKISMKRTLCSPYLAPQKMLVNVKHLVTDPTTRQLILLQVKQQE